MRVSRSLKPTMPIICAVQCLSIQLWLGSNRNLESTLPGGSAHIP
jgi:hypothetical protein